MVSRHSSQNLNKEVQKASTAFKHVYLGHVVSSKKQHYCTCLREKAAQRAVVESAALGGRAAGGNTARKVLTKFLK